MGTQLQKKLRYQGLARGWETSPVNVTKRSESPVENFFKKKKKNKPIPIFLLGGPKKGVESEYDVYFGQTWAKKIRTHFLC